MKLYCNPASTTSRIIMMFAAEEGIELDYEIVDMKSGAHKAPQYLKINPNGLVPTLDDDGFVLTESGAIIRYLADKAGSAAYPKDLQARARVDEAMEWFYSNYYKDHGYGLVYPQLFPHHKRPSDDVHAGTIAWGQEKARHWLGILDRELIGPDRSYLCGDELTIADYVGAELVTLGELVHCTYQDYPNVRRWIGNMKALEHWPEIHAVFEGFAASLRERQFASV